MTVYEDKLSIYTHNYTSPSRYQFLVRIWDVMSTGNIHNSYNIWTSVDIIHTHTIHRNFLKTKLTINFSHISYTQSDSRCQVTRVIDGRNALAMCFICTQVASSKYEWWRFIDNSGSLMISHYENFIWITISFLERVF